jgi:hypothetical protein
MDDDRMVRMSDPERLEDLPEHEDDSDVDTTGSGILSHGDTAIDRGTGTTHGTAQPRRDDVGELPDPPATTDRLERDPDEEGPASGLRSG